MVLNGPHKASPVQVVLHQGRQPQRNPMAVDRGLLGQIDAGKHGAGVSGYALQGSRLKPGRSIGNARPPLSALIVDERDMGEIGGRCNRRSILP